MVIQRIHSMELKVEIEKQEYLESYQGIHSMELKDVTSDDGVRVWFNGVLESIQWN